jgi:hypothetical protein
MQTLLHRLAFVMFALATLLHGERAAADVLQWGSQLGDQLGLGQGGTLSSPASNFAMDITPGQVTVHLRSSPGADQATLVFRAADGSSLTTGSYMNAVCAGVTGSGVALNVNVGNGGCGNFSYGNFTILDIQADSSAGPLRFAADFVLHDGPVEPAIYGGVRVNSTAPITLTAPALPEPAFIQVKSLPGDLFGLANGRTFTRNDGYVNTRKQPDGSINFSFSPPALHPIADFNPFSLTFAAPSGQTIGVGTYLDVQAYPSGVAGHPQFGAVDGTLGCFVTSGQFTILELVYGPQNTISALAADFDVHCSVGALAGAVRYNSSIPYTAPSLQAATHTARVSPVVISLPYGATAPPFVSKALDDSNNPVAGATVIFTSPCGTFNGQSSVAVIADGSGLATSPSMMVGSVTMSCVVTARIANGSTDSSYQDFVVDVFNPASFVVQDMWWGGTAENGWGMSLIQHYTTLFGALYIYDANGNPTWYVMPGGSWDSTNHIYSGSLYSPTGSPFYAYDTSMFSAGNAKGTIAITFQDANDAIIDYTIGGVTGRKFVSREIFGSGEARNNKTDLWWGGMSQNGWGVTLLQQGTTMFGVWYTYDANGKPMWYVMPGGTWNGAGDTYSGSIYRTSSSAWIGATYDPSKLDVVDVGTFQFKFTGDSATFGYTVDTHSGSIPLAREPF